MSLCTGIVQSLLSNTCALFSGIFEVFNEMEMQINVILVESKPHETTDLLITASMNICKAKEIVLFQ